MGDQLIALLFLDSILGLKFLEGLVVAVGASKEIASDNGSDKDDCEQYLPVPLEFAYQRIHFLEYLS